MAVGRKLGESSAWFSDFHHTFSGPGPVVSDNLHRAALSGVVREGVKSTLPVQGRGASCLADSRWGIHGTWIAFRAGTP